MGTGESGLYVWEKYETDTLPTLWVYIGEEENYRCSQDSISD